MSAREDDAGSGECLAELPAMVTMGHSVTGRVVLLVCRPVSGQMSARATRWLAGERVFTLQMTEVGADGGVVGPQVK